MNENQEREALPPLPEPEELGMDFDKGWDGVKVYGYTDDQMHAYARAALAAKALPADLRRAAERTREDLGPTGSNYPDVRVLLAFAEQALAATSAPAPEATPAQAQQAEPLTDEFLAKLLLKERREDWHCLEVLRAVEKACAEAWGVKLAGQGKEASNG